MQTVLNCQFTTLKKIKKNMQNLSNFLKNILKKVPLGVTFW